uniref:Uncharacterized protein n=1 Tax=viral metagenome TaxID=1070528 RepID=A0A6C0C9U4_9ZZZZ
MEVFDIINIQPNESIKVISDGLKRIELVRNITHVLHARYNMGVIIVSSSFTKNKRMKYETIFGTIESFFRAIDKKVINFDQSTILVLDNCSDGTKYRGILAKISKDNKFCNVIFIASGIYSSFWNVNTDVTFYLDGVTAKTVYDHYIDKKTMPLNIFKDICDSCIFDNNVLMIDQKNNDIVMKKCTYEDNNTYIDYYNNNFSYNKNVLALYHIYNNFSMYYDVNSDLYNGLWNNVNFIVKCSYVIFTFNILRQNPYGCCLYLPRELHTIILHFMIQTYQKNDVNKKNMIQRIKNYRRLTDRDD